MTKTECKDTPNDNNWPTLEDLKFLDDVSDPGAALGMFTLPQPVANYDLPASHDVYGTDLLNRHEWRRSLYVQDFLCETDWKTALTPTMDAIHTGANFVAEVADVKDKLDSDLEQDKRGEEILGETVDYLGVFENTLHIDSYSHPLTIFLARVAMRIGWEVAVHFKEKYGVERPVTRDPINIKPVIRTPAHPSFPSAHSTQAHLAKHALMAVIQGRPNAADFDTRLTQIANRIAENREFAGVHYKSDSDAGRDLAQAIWDIAKVRPAVLALIAEAQNEWGRDIQAGLSFFNTPTS